MEGKNTGLNSQQDSRNPIENQSFSHYLSFRFYKKNLDHFTDFTKDSINNFLKTMSEIEQDFLNVLQSQGKKNIELHEFRFENEVSNSIYAEENY